MITASLRRVVAVSVVTVVLVACGAGNESAPSASHRAPIAEGSIACRGGDASVDQLRALRPHEILACESSAPITLRAFVSPMMGAGTCTFAPIPGDGWLNLCVGPRRILVAAPGDEEGLVAYLPPDLADDVPEAAWVLVSGHYNDSAALSCDEEGPNGPANDPDHITACRLAFVLDSVQPAN